MTSISTHTSIQEELICAVHHGESPSVMLMSFCSSELMSAGAGSLMQQRNFRAQFVTLSMGRAIVPRSVVWSSNSRRCRLAVEHGGGRLQLLAELLKIAGENDVIILTRLAGA